MAKVARPAVPPGPLADLYSALHDLRERAGNPGFRRLTSDDADGYGRDSVHQLFTRVKNPPPIKLVLQVVDALASEVRGLDRNAELDRFDRLWQAAAAASREPSSTGTDPAAAARQLAKLLIEDLIGNGDDLVADAARIGGDDPAAGALYADLHAELLHEGGNLVGLRELADTGAPSARRQYCELLAESGDIEELQLEAERGEQWASYQLQKMMHDEHWWMVPAPSPPD